MSFRSLARINGIVLLILAWTVESTNASVSVYGVATSSGPYITVEIFADISALQLRSHAFRLSFEPSKVFLTELAKNEDAWRFWDGSRRLPYRDPVQTGTGEALFMGGILDAQHPSVGVQGNGVLLGRAVFGRSSSQTPAFALAIGHGGTYANFVNTDGTVLDLQPGGVTFLGVSPTTADTDLDGLSDAWEMTCFGDLSKYYNEDSDGDGLWNLEEWQLGSSPRDSTSSFSVVTKMSPSILRITWQVLDGYSYQLFGANRMAESFVPVSDILSADPPVMTMEIVVPPELSNHYYRVKMIRPVY